MNMKRLLATLLMISLVFSCQNEDSNPNLNTGDLVKEIIVHSNANNQPITKYQFQNDGENYTSAVVFTKISSEPLFDPEPKKVITFEYDDDGFIAQIDEKNDVSAQSYSSHIYRVVENVMVHEEYFLYRIGFKKGETTRSMYFNNPEDGFYLFEEKLYEIQGGNLVGLGTINEFDGGDIDQFNRKWDMSDRFFDNNPNVFANPAINYILGNKNMSRSLNRNNLTGMLDRGSSGTVPQIEFIYNGDKIDSIIDHLTGDVVQFIY